MAIEDAAYENMMGKTVMRDSYRVSNGHLCEVDKNGALRITRIDFARNDQIKAPWIISAPQKDLSHLSLYRPERKDTASIPYFPEDLNVKTVFESFEEGAKITLSFSAANDADMVHHYTVTLTRENGEEKEYRILADFYRHARPENMAKEIILKPSDIFQKGETVHATICAYNSWGNKCEKPTFSFVVEY